MQPSTYPLSFSSWGPEELQALQSVIASEQFTMGPRVAEFETAFARHFGHKHCVMVNSGSSANLIAVASLFHRKKNGLKRGDEVIVPALAWATTYSPLWQYGLNMKVVDVDRRTLNIDMEAVKKAITPRTRMIMAVSILGNPAPLKELRQLCDDRGLILFEDNCESLGAKLDGIPTGRFGDVATCSFFYAHHISTMEGGMVLTDDGETHELARSLRAHGWTRDLPDSGHLFERGSDGFNEAYRFLLPGYNVRPLEFSGATGVCQLRKLDQMIEARRENARYFIEKMAGDTRYQLQLEHGESSWYCFTVVVNPESGMNRHEVLSRLRDMRIDFRMITGGNVMRHEYAAQMGLEAIGTLSAANLIHDYGFFVGNAPFPIFEKIDAFVKTLKDTECKF